MMMVSSTSRDEEVDVTEAMSKIMATVSQLSYIFEQTSCTYGTGIMKRMSPTQVPYM